MLQFGKIVDKILIQLYGKEKLDVKELKKKVPQAGTDILDFMNECGLIELKNGEVKITSFGSELLKVQ